MKFTWKRLLSVAALSVFAVSIWTGINTASAQAATLKQGMHASAVSTLQSDLKTLGYYQYPSVTGNFGPITKSAVENFQSSYGLGVDGLVGPITQTAIDHAMVKRQIVAATSNEIGVPYRFGGTSPSTGFDCSGFVYYMYANHGVTSIPRTSSSNLYTMGSPVSSAHLQPGDLVFFSVSGNGHVSHVGIYLGNGQFVSALTSHGITVQSLNNPYWSPRYLGAKRLY